MANLRKKNYKKIKKAGWIGSLITFIIICLILTGIMYFAISGFIQFILDTKIATEYEKIEYMARLYDIDVSDGVIDHYDYLNAEGRDFMITDNSDNVIYTSGENTCTFKGGLVKIRSIKDDVLVYEDAEECFVHPVDGSLELRSSFFYSDEEEDNKDYEEFETDENNEQNFDETLEEAADMIKAPLWISVPVNDGNQRLVAKAHYKADKNDLVMLLKIFICLGIAALVIIAIIIKKIITNILRQRRLLKLYFTDDTTGGKNKTWFLLKGEQILQKGSNKNKKYAIVSLTFSNYRNYCICHSMEKGEEMLKKVHELIDSTLEAKEISAHMSDSSFALLLIYENENTLKNRLEVLIERMEHIDSSHKFDFQAGVDLIDRVMDENGNVVKRKDLDIEKEYNNACMARESLGDSDESGLEFFDDELIEERRWIDKVQDNMKKAVANEEFAV